MNFLRPLVQIITWPLRMLLAVPVRIVSAPRRFMGMSLPLRVAVALALSLVAITIGLTIVKYWYSDDLADLWDNWLLPNGPYLILLLIFIPIVVYQAIRMWLEGDASRYPDIDQAWREGARALAQQGIELTEVPLFLVVGVRDERQAKSLFDAAQISLDVSQVPSGPAPIHWYANQDAVFLVCTEVSCLSQISQAAQRIAPSAPVSEQPGMTMVPSASGMGGTIVPGAAGGGSMSSSSDSGAFSSAGGGAPGSVGGSTGDAPLMGTMIFSGTASMAPGKAAPAPSFSYSLADAGETTERLAYVCRLLRRARQPLCPANGVLTVLPFDVIQRATADVLVQRAARSDLDTLRRWLQLRCPVVALLAGMEEEAGFRELMRRVGMERVRAQRFGKGFNVWNEPTPEQVEAVCAHACKAFEDWAYLLFREKDGLTRPGNKKLYALLCKIRTEFRSRLKNIIVGSFADNRGNDNSGLDTLMFGGCYFGAMGESEDRQAFVKSVFDKLVDSEEELEWGEEALREDDGYHAWTQALLVLDGLLLIAIGGFAVWLYMQDTPV
jgi:hypothetical protein